MPLDFLFRRSDTRREDWRDVRATREPRLELPKPLPKVPDRPPLPPPAVAGAPPPESEIEVRNMSPREMANWAHEMYMLGWITWDEYRAAQPVELHPDYNMTVGALTGERAEPDRPRDMVREWEERLAFAHRHSTRDDTEARRLHRIVAILRWQAGPQDYAA
ncbi:MAG TPA: hypothetical protein VGG27_09355 [Magnetospirillaceae bacterium]|jgi:hypothetical protein